MQKDLSEYFSYNGVQLRNVQDDDINVLVSLINDAYSYQDEAKGKPRTNVEHLVTRIAETSFYVLEKDTKLVGCVYLEPHQKSLHFGLLTIAPELRGTGLGNATIDAIIKYAQHHFYEHIELDYMSLAPWLKKYYEKHGFKEIGEKVAWGSIDLIRMRLDIATIGLARGTVRLEPYSTSWPLLYKAEVKHIQDVIKITPDDIQHIGSTSIPGMVAKPIIDIAICVDSLDRADEWKNKLESIGYWYKGIQRDMPDRRFFAKGPENNRTVYLHLVNNKEFDRLITFRDSLTSNKRLATEYAELKQKLADSNANDRANYSQSKNDFIQKVLTM